MIPGSWASPFLFKHTSTTKKIHIKKGDCVADVRQQPGIRQSSAQPRQRPHTQQPPTHGDDGRDDFTKRTLCSVQVASQIDALGEGGGDGGERGGGKNNKKNCHHQNHQWNTITADENTHLVYREGPPPFPCYVLVRYLHFSQVLMWDAPKGKKKRSHGKKRSPLECHQSADGENRETKKKKDQKNGEKKKTNSPKP